MEPPISPRKKSLCRKAWYRVEVHDSGFVCLGWFGRRRAVPWTDLERVVIRTTDLGPAVEDLFWVFTAAGGICVVAVGARGENALMEKLLALPGFKHAELARAAACTDDRQFVVWEKPAAA